MNSKKNAWVSVLAPLLSIVIDQESPDLVLNERVPWREGLRHLPSASRGSPSYCSLAY
jgi:hypothetical protein